MNGQTFAPFTGQLIALEGKAIKYGNDADPALFDTLGEISFSTLDFLPRETEVKFPGVELDDHFGFILFSQLQIDTAGCYIFKLASDGGSKLWIDDKLIIDSDKPHKWRVKTDTQRMAARNYPIKVWHFNPFQPIKELALQASRIEDRRCKKTTVNLSATALFSYSPHRLQKPAYASLDSLAAQLQGTQGRKLTIIGHTDDLGDEELNLRLSLRRAAAVRDYLVRKLVGTTVDFQLLGKGETAPLVENTDEVSRRKNRRVSIIVE